MGKKFLRISYSVPADIGINFEIDPDKWNDIPLEKREEMLREGIRVADNTLGNIESDDGGEPHFSVNGYIPDKRTVTIDWSKVEIEEDEEWDREEWEAQRQLEEEDERD